MNPNSHNKNDLPIDSPKNRRLPPLLRQAWYGLNQAFRRRIAHTKVTPDQFTALRCLLEGDPDGITQRQLTDAMSSDPNTIASLLARMETSGWISREPHHKDRRAMRIQLLPLGESKYREVRQIAIELQTQILSVLPENKGEEFLNHLMMVAQACRNAADASPKRSQSKSASNDALPEPCRESQAGEYPQ